MSDTVYPDTVLLSWRDCALGVWDDPSGCVIAMPHDTDPFKVGMAVRHTEVGSEADPTAESITAVRLTWARLWTVREQFVYQWRAHYGVDTTDAPPKDWLPDENVPGWSECGPDDVGATEVWVIEWTL